MPGGAIGLARHNLPQIILVSKIFLERMEKIYCALSGLNALDPVALIGTTTKYEFNDIHNWTSHVFIACARADMEVETVQTVMKHLRETINFAQFDDSTIRDMIIHLSTIFSRKDVTQKAWYVRFIIDLLRTRNGKHYVMAHLMLLRNDLSGH